MQHSFLTQTETPTVEPVSIAEVKAAARISISVEDALIGTWIKTARELAEGFTRRAYIKQRWELAFDCWPSTPVYLPRSPAYSKNDMYVYYTDINDVSYTLYHEFIPETLNNLIVDFDSQPARVALPYGKNWPNVQLRSIRSVVFQYYAGYGEEPADVPQTPKDAIILWCAWRNENRTAEIDAPQQFFNMLRPDRLPAI